MKFEFKNLGYLEHAAIELADLTIICGKNNTGKTYVNYAIYGFLATFYSDIGFVLDIDNEIDTLLEDGILTINLSEYKQVFMDFIEQKCNVYSDLMYGFFNVDKDFFLDSLFKINLDNYQLDRSSFIQTEFSLSSNPKQVVIISKNKNSEEIEFTLLIENKKSTLSKQIFEAIVNYGLVKVFAQNYFFEPFIITSERTGVSLFYKELDINKK